MAALAVGLTVASGSTDAICFTRLGDVFSSVLTGNMVLLGGRPAVRMRPLAGHVVVAVAGFVAGVVLDQSYRGARR